MDQVFVPKFLRESTQKWLGPSGPHPKQTGRKVAQPLSVYRLLYNLSFGQLEREAKEGKCVSTPALGYGLVYIFVHPRLRSERECNF